MMINHYSMKRIGIALLTLLLGAPVLRAQDRTAVAEEVVAVVGSSMILWSELSQMMEVIARQQREQGYTSNRELRCEALEALLLQELLSNQARLDSLEVDQGQIEMLVEEEVGRMIEQYGSLRATEAAQHKPVYQIRDAIRDRYMDMALAQRMESTMREKAGITPSEVERFYRRLNQDSLPMMPEQYVYAQIVMYPPSIEEAKLRARERLLELRQRIIDGQNFATLARLYSADTGSASRGGEYELNVNGLWRPFGDALSKLRPNQISSIVETEDGFHIIQLLEEGRGDVYHFRHILIKPEFTSEEMIQTAVRLDSVAGLIRSGERTFEAAALEYSQDNFTKYNGGEMTNREIVEFSGEAARATTNRFFRDQLTEYGYGLDYNALRALKPGEVSSSYQTQDLRGNQQVKIVMLKEIIPAHRANIDDDYSGIEDMAVADKQQRQYTEWLRKKIAAMYVRIDPKYQGCEFLYEWVK